MSSEDLKGVPYGSSKLSTRGTKKLKEIAHLQQSEVERIFISVILEPYGQQGIQTLLKESC